MVTRLKNGWMMLILMMILSAIFAGWAVAENLEQIDTQRYLPLKKIKRGMKGYGKTVFVGTKMERFKVQVVDIIPNFSGPRADAILVRLSGQGLEHTGVISGMSGSPIYLPDPDDGKYKLAGAVAFGWQFTKTGPPIAGVQPIEQMLRLEHRVSDVSSSPGSGAAGPLVEQLIEQICQVAHDDQRGDILSRLKLADPTDNHRQQSSLGQTLQQQPGPGANSGLTNLTTPVMVSGTTGRVLAAGRKLLAGYNLSFIASGGSGSGSTAKPGKLEPGLPLAIPLISGDMNWHAVGTITEVRGDKVWGFGHSFLGQGPVKLPMAAGMVHAVVANQTVSFRIGSALQDVGTLTVDQSTGIFGRRGPVAQTIPLEFSVSWANTDKHYNYRIAEHRRITPALALMCLANSVLVDRALPPEHTISYTAELQFEKFGTIKIQNTSSGRHLNQFLSDLITPVELLTDSRFGIAKLLKISAQVNVQPVNSYAILEHVQLMQNPIAPGQTLQMIATVRPFRRQVVKINLSIQIPRDLPDGTYDLQVGSLSGYLKAEESEKPYIYKPQDMTGLFRAVRHILTYREDRFYIRLAVGREGLAYKSFGMPDLPVSKLTILSNQHQTDISQFKSSVVKTDHCPYVLRGSKQLKIVVDHRVKEAKKVKKAQEAKQTDIKMYQRTTGATR